MEFINVSIKLRADISDMLNRFQGNYLAEEGKRITKQEVINNALEVYITKAYEIANCPCKGKK
jgi:hypothetical protein